MGMCDWLKCKQPLPGTPPDWVKHEHEFSTKSMESHANHFEITEDGRLVRTQAGGWIGDPQYAEGEVKDFTGAVYFYDYYWPTPGERVMAYIGYTAVFVDGRCVAIRETGRRELAQLPVFEMSADLKERIRSARNES